MSHYATPNFWDCYEDLPSHVQELADKSFELLKSDPKYPSLHLKKVDRFWSARVGLHHRALAVEHDDSIGFWIGTHSDDDNFIS